MSPAGCAKLLICPKITNFSFQAFISYTPIMHILRALSLTTTSATDHFINYQTHLVQSNLAGLLRHLTFVKLICSFTDLRDMLEMKHYQTERGGEFVLEENGNRAGELAYTIIGENKITIDHTFVEKPMRGMGLGRKLVSASVEFAHSKGWKISPLCPFAKAVIEQTAEFREILES